jgi:dihydrodipicolinate synthase/N-acetylneuraminate lyase
MMTDFTKRSLAGIITPLVTPLLDRDTLDIVGLENLIEHVLAGGVHGIFLLGSSGEATSLSYRLRRELVELACAKIDGRVPVLVGITDTSFLGSLEVAEVARKAGADAVVLAPPYYVPLSQADLLGYFRRLVPLLPLPCFLYNMPSCTKMTIEVETAVAVAELEGVVGLKDSSGDMGYFHQLRYAFRARPEFSLLVGPEELLAESMLGGAHGGVNGGSNFAPRLYVDLFEAAGRNDFSTVKRLHEKVIQISRGIYGADYAGGFYLRGLKSALALLGICGDVMAEPFTPLDAEGTNQVRRTLLELHFLSASSASHSNGRSPAVRIL